MKDVTTNEKIEFWVSFGVSMFVMFLWIVAQPVAVFITFFFMLGCYYDLRRRLILLKNKKEDDPHSL